MYKVNKYYKFKGVKCNFQIINEFKIISFNLGISVSSVREWRTQYRFDDAEPTVPCFGIGMGDVAMDAEAMPSMVRMALLFFVFLCFVFHYLFILYCIKI